MKILTVLGTRPEIIKLSPLIPLLDNEFEHVVVHTGQHYSYEMDKIFFKELDLKYPKYNLEVGSLSSAHQIGKIMERIEKVMKDENPDLVIVLGDTNSTIGAALTASKLNIKLMHIEAGCRSFNRQMPEEINRIVVDHISDYLLAPDSEGVNNLLNEGINKKIIYKTGSILIDACLRGKKLSEKSDILDNIELKEKEYILATIHRAENTNDVTRLKGILDSLNDISKELCIILSCHPRTKEVMKKNGLSVSNNVRIIDSVGYLDFISLLSNSKFVMTDSGGVQEEAAILNVPALILREETEWVKYIKLGKNVLVGVNREKIVSIALDLLKNESHLKNMEKINNGLNEGVNSQIIEIIKKAEKKFNNHK